MITPRLKFLCTEIYKTLNQLNSRFLSNIFKLSLSNRAARKQQVLNLETIRPNQVNFDEKSLRALCPKMWNNLPRHIKSAGNLSTFKNLIKSWQCNAKTLRSEELVSWVFILFLHKHDFTFCKSGNKSGNKWVSRFWLSFQLDYIIYYCKYINNTSDFNPFVPNAPFFYPLKTSENRKVFWYFQGVEIGCIGNEWMKQNCKIANLKLTKEIMKK